MTGPVSLSRKGAAAILTIDRPSHMNALSRETLTALAHLARQAIADPEARVVVLTGAGEKAFCAGADLKERRNMTEGDIRTLLAQSRETMGVIDRSPKPMIAAINGVALGGGLELALACDLRVASASAVFALPETSLAIIPGAGGTQRLPRVVGEGRAKEMILLGRQLSAIEALACGLINRVSKEGVSVVDDALAFIEPITTGAVIAQAAALAAIDASFGSTLEEGLDVERLQYEPCLTSEDRRLALEAFATKTKPVFRGR